MSDSQTSKGPPIRFEWKNKSTTSINESFSQPIKKTQGAKTKTGLIKAQGTKSQDKG